VEVHCQGVHHYYLVRQPSDESSGLGRKEFMIVHPGQFASKMAFHTVFGPLVELVQQGLADGFGLESEGVAAEVADVVMDSLI